MKSLGMNVFLLKILKHILNLKMLLTYGQYQICTNLTTCLQNCTLHDYDR